MLDLPFGPTGRFAISGPNVQTEVQATELPHHRGSNPNIGGCSFELKPLPGLGFAISIDLGCETVGPRVEATEAEFLPSVA